MLKKGMSTCGIPELELVVIDEVLQSGNVEHVRPT